MRLFFSVGCIGAAPCTFRSSFAKRCMAAAAALCTLLLGICCSLPATAAERPKLIVSVSVDQLCQDYLIRFRDNFSDRGAFRRIEREGAAYIECNHRHAFTVTAPGHAVQLTGAYPNVHGIVGNNWFDRASGKDVYCCDDPSVELIGLPSAKGVSPRKLLVETVGDVLKLSSNNRSKVFGVAIKDRVAMLMTGHNADAAFWLEDNLWTTSTYYRSDLPGYLRVLNEPQSTERFRGQAWNLLLPKGKYHNVGADKNAWENPPKGFTSEFPHKLPAAGTLTPLAFGDLAIISPFGNEITLMAAREIIAGEQLGQDEFTDLLCINLSSNDFVGHAFGPHSLEVEDTTYHTDVQLGDFFRWLDEKIGAGKWTFALTADHGVAPVVEYAQQFRLPAKRSPLGKTDQVKARLEARLRERLAAAATDKPLVQKAEDYQIFLQQDHPLLTKPGNYLLAQTIVRDWLLEQEYVVAAFTRDELVKTGSSKLFQQVQRTFHPRRSGDVLFVLAPYTVPGAKGTTHGSPWHYDTHVPLLLLGCGVKNGQFRTEVSPAAIAPTLAEIAGINHPSAAAEPPLREALR
jgi:predicted AlkP superfamily pyrophosphatase or phosphodiesterase